jgi:hypothetical protein
MRTMLTMIAALALVAGGASAQSIDKVGKCHDAKGAFAKMEVCKNVKVTPAGTCRDKTTKRFAKCGTPNTEPVK